MSCTSPFYTIFAFPENIILLLTILLEVFFFNFNYLVSVNAGQPKSPQGHM